MHVLGRWRQLDTRVQGGERPTPCWTEGQPQTKREEWYVAQGDILVSRACPLSTFACRAAYHWSWSGDTAGGPCDGSQWGLSGWGIGSVKLGVYACTYSVHMHGLNLVFVSLSIIVRLTSLLYCYYYLRLLISAFLATMPILLKLVRAKLWILINFYEVRSQNTNINGH